MGEVDSSTLLAVPLGDPSQVSRGIRGEGRGHKVQRGREVRVSPFEQAMENLYSGSEGSPAGAEDCEEGEWPCPWVTEHGVGGGVSPQSRWPGS